MAQYTTVTDVYNVVADCLLEPYNSGTAPGLSLGIVTESDFLALLSVVLQDFILRSGLVWSVFTQNLNFNQSQYMQPNDLNEVKVCFIAGQHIDHSTLADLDDWQYNWRSKLATPEFWHSDGLPPKTIEVADNPNYTGAGYIAPVDPTLQPPFGVYGLFNGATVGQFTGTIVVTGTAGVWASGALFDTNWNNYYPMPNMGLAGTAWPLDSVTTTTALVFAVAPGDGTYAWTVNISNDGNLTMVGTTGLNSITFTLDQIIPVVPDSFAAVYLAFGILARIFSTDGEAKDLQRSYYFQSRYMEGVNAAAAVSGMMLNVG